VIGLQFHLDETTPESAGEIISIVVMNWYNQHTYRQRKRSYPQAGIVTKSINNLMGSILEFFAKKQWLTTAATRAGNSAAFHCWPVMRNVTALRTKDNLIYLASGMIYGNTRS